MLPGTEVKALRQRLGEKQTEFAVRFGVNQATISRWEKVGVVRGPARIAMETLLSSLPQSEPIPQPAQA